MGSQQNRSAGVMQRTAKDRIEITLRIENNQQASG